VPVNSCRLTGMWLFAPRTGFYRIPIVHFSGTGNTPAPEAKPTGSSKTTTSFRLRISKAFSCSFARC